MPSSSSKTGKLTLEDSLRPSPPSRPVNDLIWMGLLLAMAVLLPVWPASPERAFNDMLGQMLSPYLLPALGMLLVMRRGGIDLSVWANMALGGAVAAIVILTTPGRTPAIGLIAGSAAGLGVGLLSGLVTWRLRLPSPAVTIVIGGIITLCMAYAGRGPIQIPDTAFAGWHVEQKLAAQDVQAEESVPASGEFKVVAPLSVTRMLLVVAAFAITLMVLMASASNQRQAVNDGRRLVASMGASGLLAALGGAIWLIEQQSTPVPDQLIGTWRIPAAAILAGGFFLVGPGRTLMAGIFLPASLALAVAWRSRWPSAASNAMDMQFFVLIVMVIVAQASLARAHLRDVDWATFAAILSLAGILLLAVARRIEPDPLGYRIAAMVMSVLAALLLVVGHFRKKRAQERVQEVPAEKPV